MLQYRNGQFKIMQIADIQDTQRTSPDTLRLISAALEKEKPDLVIFSGDQVKSYGLNIKKGNAVNNLQHTVCNILKPISEKNIPFTYVFGNHDARSSAEKEAETAIYESYPQCANLFAYSRLKQTEGICLPIFDASGKAPQLMIFLLDTHGNNSGLYDGVTDEQIQWMKRTNDAFAEEYGTKPPALLFQHIPVYEMYDILKEVPKGTVGAIEGNNSHRERYYTINDEMKKRGEYMRENIACPQNKNGEFAALSAMGNVTAAFFGHDHINCFTGSLQGITLGYTPCAGFHVYGPGFDRGVRIIECTADSPIFTTRMLTYREIFGTKVAEKAKCKLYNRAPSSVDAVMPTVKKISLATAVVTALITARKICGK